MQIEPAQIDMNAVQSSWLAFDATAHLRKIRNEDDYARMVAMMNSLLDIVGDDEDHVLSGLLDIVGNLVGNYEQEHYAIPALAPNEVLSFLIASRNLKQSDLADVVAQGNLSAILSGSRKISATLAGKLATFFNVSPAVFIQA